MKSKTVSNRLKQNVPEFIQNSPELMSFLDAAGEFLQETKDGIEAFDWTSDYKYGTNYNVRSSLNDLGYTVPANTDPEAYRKLLRDALVAMVTKGTTDSILWVLRIIGVTPEIREAWLPSSDDVRVGYIRDAFTGERTRYDVDRFSYGDMLYGDITIEENGVFFNGSRYEDVLGESMTGLLPIKGEKYKKPPEEYTTYVEKMPYIIIRITNESFNIVTEGVTDPDTGEVIEFDNNEQYQAVEALIEFFLQSTARPANVRILIVSSLQELRDGMEFSDEFEQEGTNDFFPILENYEVDDIYDVTLTYDSLERGILVGDPVIIGGEETSPLYNALPAGGVVIETINQTRNFEKRNPEDYEGFSMMTYEPNLRASNDAINRIPIIHKTDITLTAPPDTAVSVYTLNNFTDNRTTGTVVATIQPNQTQTVRVEYPKRAFFVRAPQQTGSSVKINVEYIGYSEND